MAIRIIHRKDGIYDIYDRSSGKWLLSENSADNVLSWLNGKPYVFIDFINEGENND